MKHDKSLRYKNRMACYSGARAVIQMPYTSGRKCFEGKSAFVNDMGHLFWGRLDLCTHLQASSVTLGGGFVFHPALSLLSHSDRPLLPWVTQSSLHGNLFTLCTACEITDIAGGRKVISQCGDWFTGVYLISYAACPILTFWLSDLNAMMLHILPSPNVQTRTRWKRHICIIFIS